MHRKHSLGAMPALRFILFFAALLAAAAPCELFAQTPQDYEKIFASSPALKNGQFSFYAKYQNGGVIAQHKPHERLTPASVLKLYTTAAALDILGPKYRFNTKIYYSGALRGGKITGDLYIKGAGDPTLGSLRMYGVQGLDELISNWILQMKDMGITQINGGVYADNSIFGGVSLPWRTTYQNIGNYFAAPADGLNVRDNSYDIYFEPALAPQDESIFLKPQAFLPALNEDEEEEESGDNSSEYRAPDIEALVSSYTAKNENAKDGKFLSDAKKAEGKTAKILKIEPQIKDFKIKNYAKYSSSVKNDNAYVNFAAGCFGAEIFGAIPITGRPTKIIAAMPEPALFLADYLKTKLQESGIEVIGQAALISPETYSDKTLLLTHTSPQLRDIVKYTNKRSFNLYADSLLRSLAAAASSETAATSGAGVKEVKNFLTRLNVDNEDFEVFDGSGLSRDDLVSCKMTVDMLSSVLKKPYAKDFLDSLPLVGAREDMGNMARKMRHSAAAHNGLVKTGFLDRARAHAGYIKDAKGRQIIFCVISNNFHGPLKEVNALHEGFINSLADIGLNKKPRRMRPAKSRRR